MTSSKVFFARLFMFVLLVVIAPTAFAATSMIVSRESTGGTIGPFNTVGDDLCPANPTPGCDFADNPGAPPGDQTSTDDVVRNNDGVSYLYSVTADGPENVTLNTVLQLGMVWEDLPPSCNALTSTLTGDGRTSPSVLMCDLGTQSGYAEDILLIARALGDNPNGATSGLASAEFVSSVSPTVTLDPSTIPDVDITSAPRANLRKTLLRQDVEQDNGVNGLVATYAYYIDMWEHNTNNNATDDPDPLLGNEAIQPVLLPNGQMGFQFTEDMDVGFSDAPNAYILSCDIDTGSGNTLPNTLLANAVAGQENRAVIDAGSNACSQTGPSARVVDVYHWDADLSLSHFPTQTRGGTALPGDRRVATFGTIRVFIPLTDFDIAPTPGQVRGTNSTYGFEPVSISGQLNFLGDDQNAADDGIDGTAEDKEDNSHTTTFVEGRGAFSHLYRCAVAGGPRPPQCNAPGRPPTTATGNWAGDGAIEPTQDLGMASSLSYNNRTFLPVENLKLCSVLDATLYEYVDVVPGRAHTCNGAGCGVEGTDYIVEYGVGYVNAVWPPASPASSEVGVECSAPAANWFPTTTAALAANAGPITKIRLTRLTDLPVGQSFNFWADLRALPDTGDPAGTLLQTLGTYMEDRAQPDWRDCEYTAGSHNIPAVAQTPNGCGDRLYLTRALARMDKQTIPADQINSMGAGGSVMFQLFPSFTSIAGNNIESVQIVDTMTPNFEYVPNSATQAGVPFEPVVTGTVVTGQTLTWDLGLIPANAPIDPITFTVSTPITTANGTVLPNIARIDAPSDGSTEEQRGDQRNVTVVAPVSMVMAKQVDQVLVDQNVAFEYTVQYLNTTTLDFTLVDIIDVIPYNGDNRAPNPSAFLGTTAISGANAVSNSFVFYYSKDASAGIVTDATDPLNDLSTGGTNWCQANAAGDVDPGASPTNDSAPSNCPANATEITAIRIVDTEIMPQSALRDFKFTLTPSGNVGGDQYTNNAQGFSDQIVLRPRTANVTTVVREADRMIELEKSIGAIDGNEVTFDFFTENTGDTPLSSLTLIDDMDTTFGAGNYTVIAGPTVSGAPSTGALVVNANFNGASGATSGVANNDLFDPTGASMLPVGESGTVTVTVRIDNVVDQGQGLGNFENSATVGGTTPQGATVNDVSDDPADAGPEDDNPTVIELVPAIGTSKEVTTLTPVGMGNYEVTYSLIVENTGFVPLHDIQLSDDLTAPFGAAQAAAADVDSAGEYFVSAGPTISANATDALTIDTGFNGTAPTDGMFDISAGGSLNFGETMTVTVSVVFRPDTARSPYNNSATATGDTVDDDDVDATDGVTDISDDGATPDPDGDGDAGGAGEDDPTPLEISSIGVAKDVKTLTPNSDGSFTVVYSVVVENFGNTVLHDVQLNDDLTAPFGTNVVAAADVNIAGEYYVDPTLITIVNNSADPLVASNTFNGSADQGLLSIPGGGSLVVGESMTLEFSVLFYPDFTLDPYNNQITASGDTVDNDDVDLTDGVTDLSDDGTDPDPDGDGFASEDSSTGGDSEENDPTPLALPAIRNTKSLTNIVPSAANPAHFDATFQIVVENTGNVDLDNLTLVDDVAAQLGTTYIGVVTPPAIDVAATTASTTPTLGTFPANLFAGNDGLLQPGEIVTLTFTLQLNLAAAGAPNPLTNQSTAGGNPPGGDPNEPSDNVTDLSDDGTDPATDNAGAPGDDGAGGTDDPTPIRVDRIALVKTQSSFAPSTTTPGNFDVTYDMLVQNTGNSILDNLTLIDQLDTSTNLGTAFAGVTTLPAIVASGTTATTAPGLNGDFDGLVSNPNIFDGVSGSLEPGQTIAITMVIEVDPDAAGAPSPLQNQAAVGGNPPGGDPNNPADNVTDLSDSGTDPIGNNPGEPGDTGGSDDPVPLIIADIAVTKEQFSVAVNATNPVYTDIGMRLVVANTGTVDLDNLTLVDDVAMQLGSTYIAVLTPPVIAMSTATTDPSLGTFPINVFAGNDGLLRPTEKITIEFVLTLELGAPGAPVPLTNQVTVGGNPPGGDPNDTSDDITDDSDSGSNPSSNNSGEPGDTGGSDDPTPITADSISLSKDQVSFAPNATTPSNFDVVYNMVVQNTGTSILDNLTLIDQVDSPSNMGSAFVRVIPATLSITGGNATTMPGLNAGFDGRATNPGIFDGSSGVLEPGQTIELTVTIEVDPDAANAPSPLLNQATVGGNPPGGDPNNPADNVTDNSDSGTDPTSTNPGEPGDSGGADDPTPLQIRDISLAKEVTAIALNAVDTTHHDVTFALVVENTGTVDLDYLTLVDDVVTQLGSTYVGVTTAPAITASTATTDPTLGSFPINVFSGTDGLLEPAQSITVEFILEMDLSAAGAPVPLTNQAAAGGNPEGGDPNDPSDNVTDLSDDGADPGSNNPGSPGDTGGTDDPTPIIVNSISLSKDQTGFAPNATTSGNFDVTYNMVVQNTGTTILDNLTLLDQLDAATNLGSVFIGITTAPNITGGNATTMPGLNASFDGRATNPGIFDGSSGVLEPGQTIEINLVVEVDPDAAGAPSPLLNQATTSGNPPGGDPNNPADDVTDLSDSGTDPTSNNPGEPGDSGGMDDPTPLALASIGLAKVQTTAVRSAANPVNWDVGFQLNVINSGTVSLENLTLVDDVATQLGATYIAVTTAPSITASTATTDPTLGSFPVDVFSGTDGLLEPGQTITVDFVLEMDLNNAPVPLTNQAEVSANPVGGDPNDPNDDVTDLSDDGTDPVGDNPGAPGDAGTGNTDDPTPIEVASVGLAKAQTNFVPNGANYNVTYELVMSNNGTVTLDNLTLVDDLAAQMGPVFIGVISAPSIVASTATTDPGIGSFIPNVFDGNSGVLEPGQVITVEFVVELNPTATGAVFPITNQATAGGNSPAGNPSATSDDATDPSDSGSNPNSSNPGNPGDTGGQDDPTPLDIPSAVFGTVWLNQDGNNILDNVDTRLDGWIIEVKDANGNVVATTTTDADGNYRIEDLPSGNYEIVIMTPDGVTMRNEPVFLPPGLDEEVNQPIDPSGVIYDSSNGEPIEGVEIMITDANGDPLPAACVQPGQQNQTTGEDGVYRFDVIPGADPACPVGATQYNLVIVSTPDEYLDESNVLFPEPGALDNTPPGTDCPADAIAGTPCSLYDMPIPDSDPVNDPAPFFMMFILETGDQDVIWNHIPLDIAATPASILLSKDVNKTEAIIGDLVQYTLRAENQESFPLVNINLNDDLPGGFKYVPGSAMLIRAGGDGVFNTGDDISAPINATGIDPVLFGTINFAPNEAVLVRYFARVSTGVSQGDYVNTAVAETISGLIASNTANATVTIVEDPLLDKTTIIGKVFNDRDKDGFQDNADASNVKIGSEYFGWNSHVVGDMPGRVRPTDPIEEHRQVVRMPYDNDGDNSFRVSTGEGTMINVDNNGDITYDHSGKMAHGMTGQDLRLDLARDASDLVITITNYGIHEEGIPGVRLATVEGLLIETDQYGRYHIADVSTGHFTTGTNYIVKVDPVTLPEGAVFTTENPRVQRLTQGLMTRFNFGVSLPQVEEVAECKTETKTVNETVESTLSRTLDNVLEPIYFASGRSQIPADYADTVRAAMAAHADKQNLRLEFIGHTDNERLGPATTAKYGSNQGLSEARARMVADKMAAALDINSAQMLTSGRGDTQPVASNANAEGMALNRRVEVVLVYDEVQQTTVAKQQVIDDCTTMVSENVTETETRAATGVIDPIQFVSGKSAIPADYADKLRSVIAEYKDKENVRIRFLGHTDNERLSPSTAAKYGSNQGLSEARARMVADALASELGLQSSAIETAGYADSQPLASNDTAAGMAQNRRVEIEVLYDEAVQRVRQVSRQQRVAPKSVTLPHGGTIWATEDPAKIDPRLDISATSAVVIGDGADLAPVQFRTYTNYQAYVDRYRISVYAGHDRDLISPLAQIDGKTLKHTQIIEWQIPFADKLVAGQHLVYLLEVWDAKGRRDRTAPQLLKVIDRDLFASAASGLDQMQSNADQSLLETFGNSTLVQRTIPMHGSRVRIHGADINQEYGLTINGEEVYVDRDNRFVFEQMLPLGEHSFEVVVTANDSEQWVRNVDVTVDGDYLFYVGIANLTFGENNLSGSRDALAGDHRFDDGGFVDGRIAFYMKGKVKGKYLVTAQLDTTEDDLDNLGDNIKRKDPRSVFRRLDPDQFYPTYGDDSTTISDVDTQGAFYLRVDWDHSTALWGNYNTELTGTEFAQYNRSLYGAQYIHKSLAVTEHGDHKTELYAFASEAQTAQAHNEFLATGGSLYYLRETDIVRGSDKVWVEVRARDSERVIETVVLEEGRDYQIDYLQGRIILNRPLTQVSNQQALSIIRSQPLEGDDVVLMVDYEYVPQGFSGDDLTAGARGKAWLGDDLSIGATYVTEDRDNTADYELMGLDVTYRVGQGSWIKAEYSETEATLSGGWLSANGGLSFSQLNQSAATTTNNGGSALGLEARINLAEFGNDSLSGYINAWYKDREAGFSSTRENDGQDSTDTGIEFNWEGETLSILARANQLEQGNNTRTILNLQGKYQLNDTLNLIAEVRNEDSETADANLGFSSGGEATLFALGGEYQLSKHTRLYGSAQTVIDDDASYADNEAITFGIESQLSEKLAGLLEVSTGDRGDALKVGVDYNLRDNLNLQIEAGFGDAANSQIGTTFTTAGGLELYGSYAVDSDRTDNERRQLTIGQRKQFGDSLSIFAEQQFTNDKQESGIGHIFGVDKRLTDQLSATLSLQTSDISSDFGDIARDTATVGLSYVDGEKKASTKLEYRQDSGSENTTQWLTTNALEWQQDQHLRYLLRLNLAVTENDDTGANDGRFVEADLGLAYRPAFSDRLNILGKYTYLYDLPAQLSTGSLVGQNDSSTDERAHVLSVEALYDLRRKWEIGAKLAWRKGEVRSARDNGPWFDSGARFAAVRLRYHFIHNWDALAEYRILQSETGDDQRDGAMLALYRHVGKHLKVGVGVNFTDFSDDLTNQDYDAEGFFLDITGKW